VKILDKLKTLFEGKFQEIFKNNKFVLVDFSRNTTYVVEAKDQRVLSIDLTKASLEEKRQIKESLDFLIQTEEEIVLVKDSKILAEKISKNLPNDEDAELLEFYKGKLVPEMHQALEPCLILRQMNKKGENISEFKIKIAKQYPLFGNNMCNMVTEDYFHKHFKELYFSMAAENDFKIENYRVKVFTIVKSSPYTVFMTKYKSFDEQQLEVKVKLERLRRYGTGKLLIHGLGRDNVEKAEKIASEYGKDKSVTVMKDQDSTETVITTQLIF